MAALDDDIAFALCTMSLLSSKKKSIKHRQTKKSGTTTKDTVCVATHRMAGERIIMGLYEHALQLTATHYGVNYDTNCTFVRHYNFFSSNNLSLLHFSLFH